MDVNTYLKTWSTKLSLPLPEIEKEYNKVLQETKVTYTDLDEEQIQKRTLQRMALSYKKPLRSPAVGFEGIIIGVSDCVDMVAKRRREALELFKNDPMTAISQGVTTEAGVPLETKREWSTGRPNNMFGKPLPENSFLRNVFGVAIKTNSKEPPKFFTMSLNGSNAVKEDFQLFTPVRFMAIDRSDKQTENIFSLNASMFTNFIVDSSLILPKCVEIINTYCSNFKSNLKELGKYHLQTKDNYNRIVITEGDVSSLNLEPTAFGSRIMNIDDSTLDDLESRGTTCWLPERIKVDFAEGSRVIVVGRTAQGHKKDEQGNVTEELGDVSMNVMGVYAIPELKIAIPEVQPI